ncbi:hypothetical protein EDB85DRAFT_1896221 [Lactarius pseudohatsudake]|nr:hypothetical protein EDB85DRAFT_1896221 [Lactarius pseudohatsudake]
MHHGDELHTAIYFPVCPAPKVAPKVNRAIVVCPDRTQREQATLKVFGNAKVLPSSSRLAQLPGTLTTIMMNDSTTVRLICILIDDDLKIRNSPFTITVPIEEDFGGLIDYMKEATPSVRDKDHGNFRFYKPPLDNPICVSQSHHGFPLTREYLRSALLITCKVNEEFQEKGDDHHFDIDVIVHVDSGGCDSVKMLLGDDIFSEYFTDMNDESETRCVTAVELLHYIDILLDQHLSNQEAYRDKSVSHIYSLLRRFATASLPQCSAKFQFGVPWPFSLVAEIIQD